MNYKYTVNQKGAEFEVSNMSTSVTLGLAILAIPRALIRAVHVVLTLAATRPTRKVHTRIALLFFVAPAGELAIFNHDDTSLHHLVQSLSRAKECRP